MANAAPNPADTGVQRFSISLPRPLWLGIAAGVLAILAVGLQIGLPALQRFRAIREIESLDGSVAEDEAGPNWLRRWVGDETMRRCGFNSVTSVILVQTQATDATLRCVGRFQELKSLNLSETRITDAGLENLRLLKNLESLSLSRNNIGDRGLASLKGLGRLKKLSLEGTHVSAAGLSLLGEMTALETLNLCDTRLGDEALAEIARLPALVKLNIRGCRFGDAGLKELRALSKLEQLELGNAHVSPATVVSLKEAMPWLNVFWEWNYALRRINGEPALVTDWITIVFEAGTIRSESSGTLGVSGDVSGSHWAGHWGPDHVISWASTSGLLLIDFVSATPAESLNRGQWRTQLTRCGTRLTCRGRTVRLPATAATLVFARDGTIRLDGHLLADLEEVPP